MSYKVTQTPENVPDKIKAKAEERGLKIATQTTLVVDDEKTLHRVHDFLMREVHEKQKDIGFDIEATTKFSPKAEIVGFSFAVDHEKGFYIPIGHYTEEPQLPIDLVLHAVSEICMTPRLVMANGKYDWQVMKRHGVEISQKGKDSQVYSRLVGDIEYGVGLKPTMARLFSELPVEYDDLVSKKAPTLAHIEIGEVAKYAGADSINVLRAVHKMESMIPPEITKLLLKVEHEVARIAGDMEYHGAPIDREFVDRHLEQGQAMVERLRIETIEKLRAIAVRNGAEPEMVPDDLNLNSATQMRKVLFEVCKFPVVKRSKKTKQPSADKDAIAKMATKHKEVEWVSRFRSAEHRVGDLKELIDYGVERDGWWWVHGSLNPTGAATGRWSSTNPNLQNISKTKSVYEGDRSRWEIMLRDAFMAPPEHYIVTADYSQIELRVAAGESGSRAWNEAFREGIDVHVATAAAAFRIPVEEVTPKQRQQGKTLNFSILFGAGEDNIAGQLGIPSEAAGRLLAAFWSGLPEVESWRNDVQAHARTYGYVSTKFGRRRYFPGIDSGNRWAYLSAMRESLNTVVQGTAADILKIGLVRAEDTWKRFGAGIWLTVHDQYVWLVHESVNPREFCVAIDERISFPISGYPEIVSDFSIGRRFGSLVDFDSAEAVPESWDEVFQREDDFTDSETGEKVKQLRIEVPKLGDPDKFLELIKANPGSRSVRIVSAVPEIDMVLERQTSLSHEDALQIQAVLPGAKVTVSA